MTILFEGETKRVDAFLAENTELSRTRVQALIKDDHVRVNGKTVKPNALLQSGDSVEMIIPEVQSSEIIPENIPIDIIYEDDALIVLNKPQGLVVHPSAGHESGTLVNGLLYHVHDLSGIGGVERPGIVHRIDRMTSGLLVIAKNDSVHIALSEQFATHTAGREYLAIVHGGFSEISGIVDAPIGRSDKDRKKMAVVRSGKPAVTHWELIERLGDYSFMKMVLETGRTHQIRVHMAYIHHPLAGDDVYGTGRNNLGLEGQALHGYKLHFKHPVLNREMNFYAPLPDYFVTALKRLHSATDIDALYLDNSERNM